MNFLRRIKSKKIKTSSALSLRQERKAEHIRYALQQDSDLKENWLQDIYLISQALPELDMEEVDTSFCWLGKNLRMPLLINSITGGTRQGLEINRSMGRVARETGVAVAVGSQTAALEEESLIESFRVVRRENPCGVVLANVSASASPDFARAAVEMLEADGLQLHLNAAQEIVMQEGDRRFRGLLENICKLRNFLNLPVIVKEVGFGLSKEAASLLLREGIEYLDIGGSGGTNFVAIEESRLRCKSSLRFLGIPTPVSLLEVMSTGLPVHIIASGGISSPLDWCKVLVLGAEMAGAAGIFLKILHQDSESALIQRIEEWNLELKRMMFLQGARIPEELRKKPAVITGKTREWAQQRGINTYFFAQR